MEKSSYVYIIGSSPRGTLYIGVTSDISKRVFEHKESIHEGFTSKYHCIYLYYYEEFDDISNAIQKEKQLKKWKRDWKIRLIEEKNPTWKDLWDDVKYNV